MEFQMVMVDLRGREGIAPMSPRMERERLQLDKSSRTLAVWRKWSKGGRTRGNSSQVEQGWQPL
jgi:hypothetical protein